MLLSTISTRLVVAMTEYWWITLRIILVILPQNGFVYPDEFFQNPEVIAGDVFGYEVYTPWEYNNNSPCRNILFPLISSAVPFILLKILNIFFKDIVTTYTLLIFPRMFMLLVSFILDYCICILLMCLSLCPHQEVRFIIPTLTPLILLYSKTSTDSSKYLITLWICWNVVCGSIFGIVHEGGLLKSLGYIRDLVNDSNNVTSYDFIFYHTYTPPKHLLAYNPWLTNRPLMTIHSLPSLDESHLHNTVTRLMTQWPPGYHDKFAVYVLSPSPLQYIFDEDHDEYKYQIREQFYPHFSVQDPPDFHVTENGIFDFLSQFSLILYKVELDHTLVT
uniref:Mannosyltransferase n=1 Tax=Saccoglossus kowalevskii TaxID=10224 RepID=A0ABM0MUZ9_SACKO|nr:PREDICTED: GPI mannosyltransferase 4-like [Saccoglossus kowalevskii]